VNFQIYKNATVTLAVVMAKDGDGGCFNEVKQNLVYKTASFPKGSSMTIRKRLTHERYSSRRIGYEIDRSLFSRGWTLQEELLAPRVLYFDAEEVIYQCRTKIDCQCGRIQEDLGERCIKSTKQEFERDDMGNVPMYRVQKSWASIVEQYSSRCLTEESDRFPALSGLAKSFENRGLGAYIAGLWTDDLPLWLTWQLYSGPNKSNSEPYIAPSWSWASLPIGNAILYQCFTIDGPDEKFNFISYVKVLETNCELAGLDSMGAIKYASLCLRGRLVSTVLKTYPFEPTSHRLVAPSRIERNGWEAMVELDNRQQDRESFVSDGHAVFCLLVCSHKAPYDAVYCLVLCRGDRAGHYKRIGICSSENVYLSAHCERYTFHRPYVMGSDIYDRMKLPRSESILEEWFKDVKEQVIILV